MAFQKYVVEDPKLIASIGRVVTTSAVLEELLRSILAGLTDIDYTYVLFEGQSTENLTESLRAVLREYYREDPSNGEFVAVLKALDEVSQLNRTRNIVTHGTWLTTGWSIDSEPLPRPWSDKNTEGVDELYYCVISKYRRMFRQQRISVSDIEELADRIETVIKRLASQSKAVLRGRLDDILLPWFLNDYL